MVKELTTCSSRSQSARYRAGEIPFGYHVIKVEGVREGDVPLAEPSKSWRSSSTAPSARRSWRRAADSALAKLEAARHSAQSTPSWRARAKSRPLAQFRDTQSFSRTDTPIAGPSTARRWCKRRSKWTPSPCPVPMQLGDEYGVSARGHRAGPAADLTDEDKQRITRSAQSQAS
jgi:hypothetical protein